MLTLDEAFRKFRSRLELNDREQNNASSRHQEMREHLRGDFALDDDFLTGSYRRLHENEAAEGCRHLLCARGRRKSTTAMSILPTCLTAFEKSLAKKYGSKAVSQQRRSVCVDFGVVVDAEDNTDYRVVSMDASTGVCLRQGLRDSRQN